MQARYRILKSYSLKVMDIQISPKNFRRIFSNHIMGYGLILSREKHGSIFLILYYKKSYGPSVSYFIVKTVVYNNFIQWTTPENHSHLNSSVIDDVKPFIR